MNNILPIGSIVLLNEAEHRVMITGRLQKDNKTGIIYDYAGCLYPEGIQNSKEVLLFNEEDVQMLFFVGFQDVEELNYRVQMREIIEKNQEEITRSREQ